jgi:hypothetical protein
MKWIVISGLSLVVVYLILRRGAKPIYYRHQTSSDFQRFTESIFAQGGDGTLLFIHHESSERFVQFAKYLSPQRTVRFAFPEVPWSQGYYPVVRGSLSTAGFRCVEQEGVDGTRFVCIEDIAGAQKAAEIALVAFTAMGLGAEASYTIHQEGPVSLKEWKRYVADWRHDEVARKPDTYS